MTFRVTFVRMRYSKESGVLQEVSSWSDFVDAQYQTTALHLAEARALRFKCQSGEVVQVGPVQLLEQLSSRST
jgi:hypothetical protein